MTNRMNNPKYQAKRGTAFLTSHFSIVAGASSSIVPKKREQDAPTTLKVAGASSSIMPKKMEQDAPTTLKVAGASSSIMLKKREQDAHSTLKVAGASSSQAPRQPPFHF